VSAAEDLRDLESLKTVLSTPTAGSSSRMSENIAEIPQTTLYNDRKDFTGRNPDDSMNLNIEKMIRTPKVYRQYGGRLAWQSSPLRMDIKNLFFTYPSVGVVNSNIEGVNRPILNNISFSIPPGGYSLGIVGPSGGCNGRIHTDTFFCSHLLSLLQLFLLLSFIHFFHFFIFPSIFFIPFLPVFLYFFYYLFFILLFSGSGKSTILRVLLGLEPIRDMGPSSVHEMPLRGGSTVRADGTLHTQTDRALPNAAGSLSIDGVDVSGFDRVPCFAMAGQDSDLFRGVYVTSPHL
jgi:hypothetical protein